jgi:hypothetical protein
LAARRGIRVGPGALPDGFEEARATERAPGRDPGLAGRAVSRANGFRGPRARACRLAPSPRSVAESWGTRDGR